jgi:hypothetical protein
MQRKADAISMAGRLCVILEFRNATRPPASSLVDKREQRFRLLRLPNDLVIASTAFAVARIRAALIEIAEPHPNFSGRTMRFTFRI